FSSIAQCPPHCPVPYYFFSHHTSTTHFYTLSLHDALPISFSWFLCGNIYRSLCRTLINKLSCPIWYSGISSQSMSVIAVGILQTDRKSTRLNSSHVSISYAVFCLKKKNKIEHQNINC